MTLTPHAPRVRRPRPILIVAAVAFLLLMLPGGPRAAAEGTASVEVIRVIVTGTGQDARVEVSGTVTNTTSAPLESATVHLWRSTQILRSSTALTAALAATEAPTRGRWEPLADENSAEIPALQPGDKRDVTVSGNLADFGITAADASYWVGLTVVDAATDGVASAEIGSARTLITLPGDTPVAVATVVDLSAPPHQVKENLFLDDTLTDDLEELLNPLLALDDQDPTWLVDPALVAELTDMADGYRVQSADGSVEGQHAEDAAAWLEHLDTLDGTRVWSTLFAEPDLADPSVLPAALASEEAVASTNDQRVVTVNAPTDAMITQLADLGRPVLATGLADQGGAFFQDGVVVLPVIRPSEVTLGQALADTPQNRTAALTALARVSGDQVRLVRSAEDAGGEASVPGWLVNTSLSALLASPGTEGSLTPSTDPVRPLSGEIAGEVQELVEGVTAYAEAAPDAGIEALPEAVLSRAASRWWATDAEGQTAWLDAVDARAGMQTLRHGITLDASARFSLAGGTSDFPVTVTNTLVDPIVVTLVTDEDNPQRIKLVAPASTTIAAGSSQTVPVTAEVHGGGVIRADVHVATLEGRRLTPDASITVQTTSYGLVGWTLVIVSGIVLVVSTALRIRQVRRQQKGGADG